MTRRFTADDLEKLTEGTTPAPWQAKFTGYIIGPEGQPIVEWNAVGDRHTALPNAHLIAASPELAAEHHRIITDLEGLLDVVKHETWLHDDEGQFPETVQLGNYIVDQITRILEGEAQTTQTPS